MKPNDEYDQAAASASPSKASWIGRGMFVLLTLVGAGITISHWLQPDWLAPVTMVPPWIWLIPITLTLVGFAKSDPVIWRVFFLISLIFLAFFVEDARSIPRQVFIQQAVSRATQSDQTTPNQIRVISFNAASAAGKRLEEILAFDADLILLQESPGKDAIAELTRKAFGERGSFVWNQDTSIIFSNEMKVISQKLGQHFVSAQIEHAGQKIHAVSLRLSPPVANLQFWTTEFWREHYETRRFHRQQVETVAHEISQQTASAIIVGGDFNAVGSDGAMQPLVQLDLRDSFSVSGLGYGATGSNQYPLFRVDQVWSNSQVVPLGTTSRRSNCSDHRIVVADFVVLEQPR